MKTNCYCYPPLCTHTLYLFLTPFSSSISLLTPIPLSPPCSRQGQHSCPPQIKLKHLSRGGISATFQVPSTVIKGTEIPDKARTKFLYFSEFFPQTGTFRGSLRPAHGGPKATGSFTSISKTPFSFLTQSCPIDARHYLIIIPTHSLPLEAHTRIETLGPAVKLSQTPSPIEAPSNNNTAAHYKIYEKCPLTYLNIKFHPLEAPLTYYTSIFVKAPISDSKRLCKISPPVAKQAGARCNKQQISHKHSLRFNFSPLKHFSGMYSNQSGGSHRNKLK